MLNFHVFSVTEMWWWWCFFAFVRASFAMGVRGGGRRALPGLLCLLPLAAKGPAGVQGCLQLRETFIILSYLEQMTNASIRLAFTSLSSEGQVPTLRACLTNSSLALVLAQAITLLLLGHLCLSHFAFFFFSFSAARSASRFDPSYDCADT